MLITVHPSAPVVLPREVSWVAEHPRAADMVHELRDCVLPDAGTLIESDQSVGRARERIASQRSSIETCWWSDRTARRGSGAKPRVEASPADLLLARCFWMTPTALWLW